MIKSAFGNYLDMFPNFTESLQVLLTKNRTTYEQILPVNLNISGFVRTLLNVSTNLKEFVTKYTMRNEFFDLQERCESTILNTSKNFFSNNHVLDVFVFISSIISLTSTTLTIYLLCKHKKIRALIASLVLHQVKEVSTISKEVKEVSTISKENNTECTTLA